MTVKALTPVRIVNLVAPLAHKATDMHITDTAATVRARSGAATVLIGASPQWLNQARQQIENKLAELHLVLNPRKTELQPVARGIDFVGQVIKPWRRITRRRSLHVALDRLQNMPAADLHQSGNSYFGLLRQASHSHSDRALVANLLLDRGHVINGDLTKTFRRKSA